MILSVATVEALYASCSIELPLQTQTQLALLQLTIALCAFFPKYSIGQSFPTFLAFDLLE